MPRLESFCHRPQLSPEDIKLIGLIEGISKINLRNKVSRELLEAIGNCELYLIISFVRIQSYTYFLIIFMNL